ncbi:MAG: NAD+ synthase [Caldisericia bacterium]|nr:NAD+ synthase [Caldisericia bacterium]
MMLPLPAFNPAFTCQVIQQFIQEEVRKSNLQGAVISLSGGLDSSVIAKLSYEALQGKIRLLYMPYRDIASSDRDVQALADQLHIPVEKYAITEWANHFFYERQLEDPLRKGNVLARLRMVALFDVSAREKALVVGSSNKTEILVGYSTWYGDSACAILPIGDLYKTQVRALAEYLDIPDTIRSKPPSAELWENQTDEGELGVSYADLDSILYYLVDEQNSIPQMIEKGFPEEIVRKVRSKMQKSYYKQRMPIVCKCSNRTIGVDYRYNKDAQNAEEE